jgi:uncharacterized membrane protein YkgB
MSLANAVAASSLLVSVIYLVIGLLMLPGLRFDLLPTLGGGLFFVGCALTHAHICVEVVSGVAHHGLALMLALHLMQVVGGAIFVFELGRKRLVVRLEE